MSLYFILIFFISGLFCEDFPCSSLIHYSYKNEEFGNKNFYVNGRLSLMKDLNSSISLTRYFYVLTFSDLLFNIREHSVGFFSLFCKRSDNLGVLILLPPSTQVFTEEEKTLFGRFERYLMKEVFTKPIYFLHPTPQVQELLRSLQNTPSQVNPFYEYKYGLLKPSTEEEVDSYDIYNFYGHLDSANSESIVILSNYDTLSVLPLRGSGVESTGSGVLTVFELARLFSHLYDSSKTKGGVSLLFVLTGGERVGYEGTRNFIKKYNMKNVKFVLCVDSFGGEEVYLHLSKKTEDNDIIRMFRVMKENSGRLGVPFKILLNKGQQGNTQNHEVFQKVANVQAAMISSTKNPRQSAMKSSIIDITFDIGLFRRNIEFLSRTLIQYIYNISHDNSKIIYDYYTEQIVDDHEGTIKTWVNTLQVFHRTSSYLNKNSPIITGIKKTLSKYLKLKVQSFKSKSAYTFYQNVEKLQILKIYNVKPVSFYLLLLGSVCVYLLALYLYLNWEEIYKKDKKKVD